MEKERDIYCRKEETIVYWKNKVRHVLKEERDKYTGRKKKDKLVEEKEKTICRPAKSGGKRRMTNTNKKKSKNING